MTARTATAPAATVPAPNERDAVVAAIQFLTRVPLPGPMDRPAEWFVAALRRGVRWFPVVGGLVGLVTAGLMVGGVAVGLDPLVAAAVALGLEAALTGAFHEDAFADTWDALGGGWTREQTLTILTDSRLGTYGTLGLVVGLLVRAASMATLAADPLWAVLAIVAAASLGRLAIVAMMATTPPVEGRDSAAKDVSGRQTPVVVAIAAVLSGPLWIGWGLAAPLVAAVTVAAAIAVAAWFRRKIVRRLGGTTGDLLGCTAYLVQLVVVVGSTLAGSPLAGAPITGGLP